MAEAFARDIRLSKTNENGALTDLAIDFAELDLSSFDGPLELLDYLFKESKLPLAEISISKICDYYLAVIEAGQAGLDMALATEFLLVAAQLLQLKSRLLLPVNDSADPEADDFLTADNLIFKLMAFRRNKLLAEELERRHPRYRYLSRVNEFAPELSGFSLARRKLKLDPALFIQAIRLLQIQTAERFSQNQAKFKRILKLEPYSVKQKLKELWTTIADGESYEFRELLNRPDSLGEQLAAFLAVLELLRRNKITAVQENLYAPIIIRKEESATTLDFIDENWKESGFEE
ncbi:MAG: segregation/condensation protein A [Eubacteriales bacterium]|nr:segregation/condensation protein A [Eubacteriales bacterium]